MNVRKQISPLQFALLFLVTGIICLSISLWQKSQDAIFRDRALRATAVVTKVYSVGRPGSGSLSDYRFTTSKGQSVAGIFNGRGKLGGHIEVEYLPEDPTQNRILLSTTRTAFFFFFGIVALCLSLWAFIRMKNSDTKL
jgi:hypothetical protein